MTFLKHPQKTAFKYEIQQEAKKHGCKTIDEFINLFYQNEFDNISAPFIIYKRYVKKNKQTLMQRLNVLWVYPLFTVMIPFRYLLFGEYKVVPESKASHILDYLIGEDYR